MSLFDKIKKLTTTPPLVCAPTEEHPNHVEAMVKVLEEVWGEKYEWALFVVGSKGDPTVVHVVADFIIVGNEEPLDLPSELRASGLPPDYLDRLIPCGLPGKENSQHCLIDATPKALAEIVHAIFRQHYALAEDYSFEGYVEW